MTTLPSQSLSFWTASNMKSSERSFWTLAGGLQICSHRMPWPRMLWQSSRHESKEKIAYLTSCRRWLREFCWRFWLDPLCQQEQTKHNLLALMLLGMQSLANGPYWQILRIYTERGLLKQVRENPQRVWAVIVEELHNHPPSAPILMPYRAKRNSTIRGQTILEGTVVVISPPWSHAMMGGAPQESTNPTGCPFQRSSSPIRSLQNAMGQCAHPRSYAFGASTRSSCPVKGFNMATMYSVITGFVDLYDMKVHDPQRLCCMKQAEHMNLHIVNRPSVQLQVTLQERNQSHVTKPCGQQPVMSQSPLWAWLPFLCPVLCLSAALLSLKLKPK
ncbi:unnamed protein product [Durusdinium trenchii]|uniref:Uncharacterized protein n=1 Tax=Durusdinium trenchii TaxID=1381693 RepID=A0ABP0SFN4_9DINO